MKQKNDLMAKGKENVFGGEEWESYSDKICFWGVF